MNSIAVGIAIGVVIGLTLGVVLDRKARQDKSE
jgi:hypothetical protein